jgi:hypothetical protein
MRSAIQLQLATSQSQPLLHPWSFFLSTHLPHSSFTPPNTPRLGPVISNIFDWSSWVVCAKTNDRTPLHALSQNGGRDYWNGKDVVGFQCWGHHGYCMYEVRLDELAEMNMGAGRQIRGDLCDLRNGAVRYGRCGRDERRVYCLDTIVLSKHRHGFCMNKSAKRNGKGTIKEAWWIEDICRGERRFSDLLYYSFKHRVTWGSSIYWSQSIFIAIHADGQTSLERLRMSTILYRCTHTFKKIFNPNKRTICLRLDTMMKVQKLEPFRVVRRLTESRQFTPLFQPPEFLSVTSRTEDSCNVLLQGTISKLWTSIYYDHWRLVTYTCTNLWWAWHRRHDDILSARDLRERSV